MQTGRPHRIGTTLFLTPLLLLTTLSGAAQYNGQRPDNPDSRDTQSQRGDQRVGRNYYSGVRDGGHQGNYDRNPNERYQPGYDDRYHQPGGIGPGKGAAIGAAGGAVLGALFGGGLKGAVIGGAAGAGVGAIAGKANQDHRRDNY